MRFNLQPLLFCLIGILLSSCTWVKPTLESDQVRIVPLDRVKDCKKLGDITTYTKAVVAGVNRKKNKVRQEIETLARTEAVDMKANTLVVKSEIVEGKQTFIAYDCPM